MVATGNGQFFAKLFYCYEAQLRRTLQLLYLWWMRFSKHSFIILTDTSSF